MGSETAILVARDDDSVGRESVHEVRNVVSVSTDGLSELRYPD
jgi:hypothetical protein